MVYARTPGLGTEYDWTTTAIIKISGSCEFQKPR
jgi:hypothetical protein